MKPVKLFLSLILLILNSCVKTTSTRTPREINYVQLADCLIENFCKKMCTQYGLNCYASGGSFAYDIQSISLSFMSDKVLEIDEARHLEIATIEDLLFEINSDTRIRPYLREYPFTPDRINISLACLNEELIKIGDLESVFQAHGTLFYHYNAPGEIRDTRTEEEPYEEALKKVAQEYPELLERIHHEKIDS